jgi:hypothetical protein
MLILFQDFLMLEERLEVEEEVEEEKAVQAVALSGVTGRWRREEAEDTLTDISMEVVTETSVRPIMTVCRCGPASWSPSLDPSDPARAPCFRCATYLCHDVPLHCYRRYCASCRPRPARSPCRAPSPTHHRRSGRLKPALRMATFDCW